jgi:putative membrane-bound dehydrogenase-like protein
LLLSWCTTAAAQRGQFDKSPVIEAEEAYIFTPPGFTSPGKPATASGPDAATFKVTVVDAATGKPTLCRVNVVGADGNYYEPRDNPLADFSLTGTWPERLAGNRTSKAPIRYFGHFFYTPGQFEVVVPKGKTRIEVWKGFEYRPEVRELDLAPGGRDETTLTIARTTPMATKGYYSGDQHLHFIRASDRDDETVFNLLEAEDIRFGMVLAYNETNAYPGTMPELVTPQLRGLGAKSIRKRGDYQIISGQEYRNVVFGHVLLFGRDSLVLDGQQLDPNLGPLFGEIGVETRKQGGYSFHAHGGYAQEIWADLIQGATDGVELLQFGIYRGIGLDGWYHVLNCGFRFPGMGACDYPACRKLGDCRTYVHIDGEPTFDKWLAGAAAGRSFMTSGPLIELTVDGKRPGDVIALDSPRKLPVRLEVNSVTCPVTHIQLLYNGRVIMEYKPQGRPDAGEYFVHTSELDLTEPAWIAARAFSKSPSGNADAESHTNPVYVEQGGRKPFSPASADWLLAKLDEQIADHAARDVPEKSKAVEYFQRAREILVAAKERGSLAATAEPAAALVNQKASDEALAEFLKPVPALPPAEAVKSFEVPHGFRMELVAHEPLVTDPVAACFDENGGMYVAEMIDYPYRPQDGPPLGRVRYLQDTDGDGRYDQSSLFAEQLAWPTGVVCWKGGVFIAAAPDIWYCRDIDGDHIADERRRVFTGFGDRNQQGGVNNLNWGIDHHIYGAGSVNGGEIRPADKTDAAPIVLSGRDFCFDPVSGAFETITGNEQFGNAFDDWFHRFICSESNPLVQVVLPQRELARNPYLAVPTGLKDLSPGVTPIFRISPIERWRQIRSTRRLNAGERKATSAGLSHEVIDAAAGLTVYRGHAYPEEYRGNVFVGCSQNNLVHRRKLIPDGVPFRSERADQGTEFVRSSDIWFRPVNCINAPDGTLYVLDMSREVIESIHISQDVVKHLDLTNGRDKGRIYRLAPPGFRPPPQPQLGTATTAELAALLEHPGGWWRDTASRLIFERQDTSIVEFLRTRLREAPSDVGRLHLLYALDGLQSLADDDLITALSDKSPGVRNHAVQLAAARVNNSPPLLERVIALASDDDPQVRFQVAFALGESSDSKATAALAAIAQRDTADEWIRTAVLSSCASRSGELLQRLATDSQWLSQPAAGAWCSALATIVGARYDEVEIQQTLAAAAALPANSSAQRGIVLGLGEALQRSGNSLTKVSHTASPAAAQMVARLLADAARTVSNSASPVGQRIAAARLLSCSGDTKTAGLLVPLVDPQEPEELQLFALRMLAAQHAPAIATGVIPAWQRSTPKVQEEIIALLASRAAWANELLAACDRGDVSAAQITGQRRAALLNFKDEQNRTHAERLFSSGDSSRSGAIANFQPALTLTGDAARGDKVYEQHCQACHQLAGRGFPIGPNLALVRNRTDAALLEAILDPNREVHPNYVNYVVLDDSGRTFTGLITSESATSITLARDKGASDTVLKQNVEAIKSTGKSLMPEGLEKDVTPQQIADLLAFLKQMQYDIGTRPDFVDPED